MEARDRISLNVQDIRAQRTRFDAAAEAFGTEYAHGQSAWSVLRTPLAWVRGVETPKQRITRLGDELKEEMTLLVEFRARVFAANLPGGGIPTTDQYRERLTQKAAKEQIKLSRRVARITDEANTNLGVADDAYRGYISENADAAKFLIAGLSAGAAGVGLIQGEAAVGAYYFASGLGGLGLMDLARRGTLRGNLRHADNINAASRSELLKRVASIEEGNITGDEGLNNELRELYGELQIRAQRSLGMRVNSDNILRPNFMLPSNDPVNKATRETTRKALTDTLAQYSIQDELIRSKDSAKGTRRLRLALAATLITGLATHYLTRPAPELPPTPAPYCGIRQFPVGDPFYGDKIRVDSVHSFTGIAEEIWYKRTTGESFRPEVPEDRKRFNDIIELDEVGNRRTIGGLARALKEKNQYVAKFVSPDGFTANMILELCPEEINEVFRQAALTS